MITEKAIYWMAVGLVALVAGNHFTTRFDGRCLGNRTMAVIEQISGGPAFAAILDNTASSNCARVQARMARAQARMAAAQVRFASMQDRFSSAQDRMARPDAMCTRLMALQQMREMRLQMAAPSQSFSLQVPQIAVPTVRLSLNDGSL